MNQNLLIIILLSICTIALSILGSRLLDEVFVRVHAYSTRRQILWYMVAIVAVAIVWMACVYMLLDTNARSMSDYSESTLELRVTGVVPQGNLSWSITWDKFGTQNVTSIDWGELKPGTTKNITVYIQNKELYAGMLANISSYDWSPVLAEQYMNVTWSFGGLPINPRRQREVKMFLAVAPDITNVNDFNFTILINAWTVPIQ